MDPLIKSQLLRRIVACVIFANAGSAPCKVPGLDGLSVIKKVPDYEIRDRSIGLEELVATLLVLC